MIRLAELMQRGDGGQPVALHRGREYDFAAFRACVAYRAGELAETSQRNYALYCDDAYPFAVSLFALLHAGKRVWIVGNNRPGTAEQMRAHGCQLVGDWQGHFDYKLDSQTSISEPAPCPALDPGQAKLVIFTSGSTGDAQAIPKSLSQLQAEVDTLERLWGSRLGASRVLATVSHQHIYGLLFRVLWPLAAGRCFHSETAVDLEFLSKLPHPACWIASPAHLKRLSREVDWLGIGALRAIFSSGGSLPEQSAEQLLDFAGQAAIEVYGSSETGGIAWRQFPEQDWTLFDGLSLRASDAGALLNSPYLPDGAPYVLDDIVDLQGQGRFSLRGRRDRIVKIEQKRLSLDDMERRLLDCGWFDEATALVLQGRRDTVAVTAVLSGQGLELLQRQGRNALVKRLRATLMAWFEPVLLPRRWLFLNCLPLTAQGKLDTGLLRSLLSNECGRLPTVQSAELEACQVELRLKVPRDLRYFADHFPGYPILPGVVQIGWAEYFARLLLAFSGEFGHMEAIKFVKPILPDCELKLKLNWQADRGKLSFQFFADERTYSSGRLIYRATSA